MAKSSDIAKDMIMKKLAEIYPDGRVIDKKFYVNFSIEGEPVQIAISLTAPKTPLSFASADVAMDAAVPAAMSATEIDTVKKEVEDIFNFFSL